MKLRVYNNWGNYEWTLGGSPVDVRSIDAVTIKGQGYDARAVEIHDPVYDHGHTYDVKTYDLEIETEVAGIQVWVSLYKNPKLTSKVTKINGERRTP